MIEHVAISDMYARLRKEHMPGGIGLIDYPTHRLQYVKTIRGLLESMVTPEYGAYSTYEEHVCMALAAWVESGGALPKGPSEIVSVVTSDICTQMGTVYNSTRQDIIDYLNSATTFFMVSRPAYSIASCKLLAKDLVGVHKNLRSVQQKIDTITCRNSVSRILNYARAVDGDGYTDRMLVRLILLLKDLPANLVRSIIEGITGVDVNSGGSLYE